MANATPRGRFVWHELLTTDPEAAKAFYTKIIGWGTMKWDVDPSYTMWTNSGAPLGGLTVLSEEMKAGGAPPHWMMSVAVPDVDSTVSRARQLGASVMAPPMDIPSMGRYAVMADPQGAAFSVFASSTGDPGGHDGTAQKGEFSWHELATTDHVAAFNFYRDLFGWEKSGSMDMGPAGLYQMYRRMGVDLGGMYNKPPEMPAPPHWLSYMLIDDVNKGVKLVKQLGGTILNGPMEVPGGDLIAQCMDPQGAAFAIHSRGKAAATAKPAAKPKKAATKPAKKAAKKTIKKAAKKKPAKKKPAKKTARKAAPKKKAGKPKRGK